MVKKPAAQDWHKEQIKAELHMRGITLKGLTLANGYRSVDAVAQALHRPYPKAERIIAAALEIAPESIWPSRYRVNKLKCSATIQMRHVNSAAAA